MAIVVKRPEGVVDFCTDQSRRVAWEQALEALETARTSGSKRLVDSSMKDAANTVQELEAQMLDSTLTFKLRALPRRRWQELVAENPPRDDNSIDVAMGLNQSTFFDAVLMEPGTILAVNEKVSGNVVDFDPAAEWMDLADEMTDAQWSEFAQKVMDLNRGAIAAPKSRLASQLTRGSSEN